MRVCKVLSAFALVLVSGAVYSQESRGRELGRADVAGDPSAEQRRPLERSSRMLPLPVVLDGVRFPARTELPDQALSIFVLKDENGQRVLHAFSSPVVAAEFKRQLREGGPADRGEAGSVTAPITACTWTNSYSWFNKNVGCGGSDVLTLTDPNQYTDLDFNGWNNTISCVKAACNGLFTVIYSCRNFTMTVSTGCGDPDRWYIAAGDIITDLNTVGQNNSTSSIRFE